MVPIYVKTVYSFLESIITIDNLIDFAKEKKFKYLCICDNNMYAAMEFITKCQDNNIIPIVGLDIGMCLLFAKNYEGYLNLLKITKEETITKDILRNNNSNLICFQKEDEEVRLDDLFDNIYFYSDNKKKDNYLKKILCLKKQDVEILKYLYLLRENKTISDEITYFDDVFYEENHHFNFFDLCDLKLPKYSLKLPEYNIYNDTKGLNNNEFLSNLAINGLYKRLSGKIEKEYKERLLYELDVIKKMDYSNYFLIVYDYIKYAKKNNILVGPGRGSAAGSLVAFSIGITDVDPIKYHLLFERFLNSERISMPDIDTDFPFDKRDLVIDYCINKYGFDKVAGIITFNTFGANLAIRDMGRVMNIKEYVYNELLKKLNPDKSLIEQINNPLIKNLLESDNRLKKCYEVAMQIEGIPKNSSIHASGVIISSVPLFELVPINVVYDKYIVGYSSSYLENLGLLKMDFLANRNLTIVANILDYIKEYEKKKILFQEIPLNDKKTYQIFSEGNTSGIFQFENEGMREFLKKLRPVNFQDLYNANAFYRPGPSNNIPLFLRRREKKEPVHYYDDRLKDILCDTEGIIVYQEQVMLIANRMADFTMNEADILRRAISKKKISDINKMKTKFVTNAINNNYDEKIVNEVFNYILDFAGYGFNKSHSVAYSLLSYKMAYLKANYPKYFYLAILNSSKNDVKLSSYINEIKKQDIKIKKPHINKSIDNYIIYYDYILLPLNVIKGISSVITKKIMEIRGNGFQDIYDFFVKMVQAKISVDVLKSLIMSGALDELYENRHSLIDNLESLINYGNLVENLGVDFVLKPDIIATKEYDKETLINSEKELFGFYLSNHPVNIYRNNVKNSVNMSDISKYFNKHVICVGMINKISKIHTKTGEEMAFINVEDELSSCTITVFPKIYQELKVKNGDIIIVEGKIQKRKDYEIIADRILNVKEIK